MLAALRLGLVVVSLALLWLAEQTWTIFQNRRSELFQPQPELLLLAVVVQVLAGAAFGFALLLHRRWTRYRPLRAAAIATPPLLLVLGMLAFEIGIRPHVGSIWATMLVFAFDSTPVPGLMIGVALIAGIDPVARPAG